MQSLCRFPLCGFLSISLARFKLDYMRQPIQIVALFCTLKWPNVHGLRLKLSILVVTEISDMKSTGFYVVLYVVIYVGKAQLVGFLSM